MNLRQLSFFVPPNVVKEVMTLSMTGLNFVRMRYGMNELKFLIDTGASISLIFASCLESNEYINNRDKIKIKGIAGTKETIGSCNLTLDLGKELLTHKFHTVHDFDLEFNGVLGSDFFEKYLVNINYEKYLFTFCKNQNSYFIPLESKFNVFTTIPARCEVIKYFECDECVHECVVCTEEVTEGVFVASSVVKPYERMIPVRILNVNDREVQLKNFRPKIDKLSNFYFCKFNKNMNSVDRVDNVLNQVNIKNLTTEEKTSIEKICAKYADVFHIQDDKLSVLSGYKQKIHLQDNNPVYIKPYRLPYAQRNEIHKQIEKMQVDGIIEPSKSEWASPLLIVPKKPDSNGNKKWRVVIDYRQLNKKIENDKFPLPCIDEILDALSGAVYFSHLDLYQGYYQVELDKDSRPYTAFTTDRGQFQMTRLPMGLKVSPNSFSRAMTLAMSGLNYENCFVYLDDLIVFGNNLSNHNINLVKVLQRLRKVNLKLNPAKCEFLKKEILYLGHVISSNGISPDPEKIKALQMYPVPTNGSETKRFVAFANYYRKFIKNFAELTAPLNRLSRKGVEFIWSNECQVAFETLKYSLSNPPILQYPDFSENSKFILHTDASGYAVGAVLSNSNKKAVAYASRALNSAEKNYCTIEKELLAIVWGVQKFRPYLFGRKFEIYTDHKPLIYLFGMKNPSSRLTKFRLKLEEFDFTVNYIKGKDNAMADALSRIKLESKELKDMCKSVFITTRAQAKELNKAGSSTQQTDCRPDHPGIVELLKQPSQCVQLIPLNYDEFNKMYNYRDSKGNKNIEMNKNDNYNLMKYVIYDKVSNIIYMQEPRSETALGAPLRALREVCKKNNIAQLMIMKNKNRKLIELFKSTSSLIKNNDLKICVIKDSQNILDKETQQLILNDFHILPTGGHSGINRMFNNIKRYYCWSGLKRDVEDFVKRCVDCQKNKHSVMHKYPMTITTTATAAFQKIFLDLVGPLEVDNDNNRYILTLQCELTKYVEGYPIPNKEASTVAKSFVENFILRFGIPDEIVTDKGTEFLNSTINETCKLLKIKQLNSTAYHHETLGALENSHKNLGAYLRIYAFGQKQNWSSWVQYWCFAYNNNVHSETQYTPYELVFGKTSKLPSNVTDYVEPLYNFDSYPSELKYRLQVAWQDARNNLVVSKLKRKEIYDRKSKFVDFKLGDKVLVKDMLGNKCNSLFKGPYEVIKDNKTNLVIKVDNKNIEVHKNRVKIFRSE